MPPTSSSGNWQKLRFRPVHRLEGLVFYFSLTWINARSLALQLGCSTQPIFRVYKDMAALKQDLFAYFHGIASMLATNQFAMQKKEIEQMLHHAFFGFLHQLKVVDGNES
jgi:hypothetical protein